VSASLSRAQGKEVERDLREEARREVQAEAEARERAERDRIEQEGLRWRRRARGEEYEYAMPGSMPVG